jgi:hypothetical protein
MDDLLYYYGYRVLSSVDADADRVTTVQLVLRFSLPHDSTDYAGPVSPLLTLVVFPEAGFITLSLDWTSSSTSLIDSHGHVRVAWAAHVSANVGWGEELEPLEALMGPGCLESRLTESPIVTHRFHVGSQGIDFDLDTGHLIVVSSASCNVCEEPPVVFLCGLLLERVELCGGADDEMAEPWG